MATGSEAARLQVGLRLLLSLLKRPQQLLVARVQRRAPRAQRLAPHRRPSQRRLGGAAQARERQLGLLVLELRQPPAHRLQLGR